MKKWKERGKRIAVLLLTAALVGSSVDVSALTGKCSGGRKNSDL